MKNKIKQKFFKNPKDIIINLFSKTAPDLILKFSSIFFMSIFILTFFDYNYISKNNDVFLYIFFTILLIDVYVLTRTKLSFFINIIGSIIFFFFLINAYIGIDNIFSRLFIYNFKRTENALNVISILIAVYFSLLIITIYLIHLIFSFANKNRGENSKLMKFIIYILKILGWILIFLLLLFIFFNEIILSDKNLESWIINLTNKLIPILGFSLIYLHGKLLLKSLINIFRKNNPHLSDYTKRIED